jgi:hypothetical protein
MELNICPTDLGTTFRKAKVDLYYSTNPSLFAMGDYEENLQRLQEKINGRSTAWVKEPKFLGTWTLAAKAIKCGKDKDADLISASQAEWAGFAKMEEKPLRVTGDNHDYCNTGETGLLAQRRFQLRHHSPSEGFKPVHDGFAADMSKDRKELSRGRA